MQRLRFLGELRAPCGRAPRYVLWRVARWGDCIHVDLCGVEEIDALILGIFARANCQSRLIGAKRGVRATIALFGRAARAMR